MSDERMKVKDLATALGKDAKEVLAAAKVLGITAAKVGNSSLSDLESEKLRNHFSGDSEKRDNVIVRRRRKDPAANDSSGTPVSEEKAVTAQVASKNETQPEEPSVKKAASPKEHKKPEAEQPAKPAGARIVRRPGDVVKKEETTPVAPPVVEASAKADSLDEQSQKEIPVQSKEITEIPAPKSAKAKEEKPAVEKTAAKVVEEPKEKKSASARIIRPAAYSAEPEKTADGSTVSSAPVMPSTKSEGEESKNKAKLASTASQVRVISRPAPQEARQPRENRNQPSGNSPRPQGQDNRPARPAGENRFSRPNDAGKPSGPTGRIFEPYVQEGGEQGRKKRQKGRRSVDFATPMKGDDDSGWSKAAGRRGKGRNKGKEAAPKGGTQPVKAVKRKIKVEEFIRVSDLAHQMGIKAGDIIKTLFNLGVMATINQSLDIETATLVAIEFGYEVEKVGFSADDFIEAQHVEEDPSKLVSRPPVVTIMGHVDHGKTSLLDAIRKSSVVSGEAGGITQHIGAYHVTTKKGEIVFLDTPGHEAFTAMRARGAEITDLVVLVVAADDGVMEQTREAINHARAAGVPIMVAVNKIDKPGAEPGRVKRELSEHGLVAEDWGGDTVFTYVSAKTREGLDDLLELLALQADIMELKANPDRPAIGHIIEAKLDKGRGALGTVLIQQGTLHQGDVFVCGIHSGRVRAMFNDQGKKVKEATPSMPVEVQGFEGVPEAGEEFICIADEKTARRIAESRAQKQRERDLAKESKITLETFLASRADDVEAAVLNLVIKSDVQGSLEAIIDAMRKLSTEKVRIEVIHGGTGAISESDILLATASNAIVIGFNVRPTAKGKELAEQEHVDIRFYDIIYKLVDEIKSAMEGMLAPVEREVILGTADVRETFSVPKIGTIAGCHISDGKIVRNCSIRLLRDGVVVHTGKLASLRRFKDDVREVSKGYECGIGIENFNDIKVGDVIEAFEVVAEAAKL